MSHSHSVRVLLGHKPKIAEDCFIAENASLIGQVEISRGCSIWYNVVLRGDVNTIFVGAETNIQDATVVHATYKTHPTYIGNRVTIGHGAIIHGCHIEDSCLIGMGTIIMDGARIGANSLIGAGSLIPEGKIIPPGSLVLGRPGVVKRSLTQEEIDLLGESADNYLLYKSWYESPK